MKRHYTSKNAGATRVEKGNLLENFKIDMMSSISLYLDVMIEKNKKLAKYLVLGVFFLNCIKKHSLREFPLDKVEVFVLCDLEHDTKYFPSLPKVKAVFQASTMVMDQTCFLSQKKAWPPHIPCMNSDPPYFNS